MAVRFAAAFHSANARCTRDVRSSQAVVHSRSTLRWCERQSDAKQEYLAMQSMTTCRAALVWQRNGTVRAKEVCWPVRIETRRSYAVKILHFGAD
eukprot:9444-Heterococcus_DN1.PRE.2